MADFPYISGGVWAETDGVNLSNSQITRFNADNISKTSWQELTANTANDVSEVLIMVSSSGNLDSIFDIGIGSSGNEQILVADLLFDESLTAGILKFIKMPLSIPSGSRVSVRAKLVAASDDLGMAIIYYSASFTGSPGSSSITTYGVTESPVGGVDIDAGGTANTKGAWTEITSSCVAAECVLLLLGGNGNSTMAQGNYIFDIGIGSSGNEQILVADIAVGTRSQEIVFQCREFHNVTIPDGSRLSVRSQSQTTVAAARVLDCALYLGN